MSEQTAVEPELPLEIVPAAVASAVADLGYAGRYIPAGPGQEPIAGDFYDVLRPADDRIAVVIGDVAGHGPPALARMLQLRAATRTFALAEPVPGSGQCRCASNGTYS